MQTNIMLMSDSYKMSHYKQYPEGTEVVYSYLESRGGKFDELVFFGLRYFIMEYLQGQVVTQEKIDEAEVMINAHMGPGTFNRAGWEYILNEHNGMLPVKIRAVKEGTVVGAKNVLMTVENTDPECFWLTNFLETLLLQVWYPITVATLSRECKKLIADHLKATTDYQNQEEFEGALNFKLHDFGFRGVSSVESAAIGGAAHLVNFKGSDTFAAIPFIRKYYGGLDMPAFSIPASEHSTITSWGRSNERMAFENMLDKYPAGLVACVSDSFDIEEACEFHWPSLKDKIMQRDGTLVIRPDSGHIKMTLQVVLSALWKHFGGEIVNGYKILDPHVRVIQGDGMNYDSLKELLSYLQDIGFSIDNVAFGMGGALLQKVDRDTQKFAFKCSAIKVDGEWRDVFKAPTEIDENGDKQASFKKSKTGRMSLVPKDQGGWDTITIQDEPAVNDALRVVFEDGEHKPDGDFTDVIKRARI